MTASLPRMYRSNRSSSSSTMNASLTGVSSKSGSWSTRYTPPLMSMLLPSAPRGRPNETIHSFICTRPGTKVTCGWLVSCTVPSVSMAGRPSSPSSPSEPSLTVAVVTPSASVAVSLAPFSTRCTVSLASCPSSPSRTSAVVSPSESVAVMTALPPSRRTLIFASSPFGPCALMPVLSPSTAQVPSGRIDTPGSVLNTRAV